MNNLLYDEYPLLISPTLATKIGLNEAIILQQINYWTKLNEKAGKNFRGGYHWTFNSYSEWRRQFPFLSESTIRRAITKLEKAKLIISGNYNRLSIDRTKWYRINYELVNEVEKFPSAQFEQINWSEWTDHISKMDRAIPETNSETKIAETRGTYINLPIDGHPFFKIYNWYFHREFGKNHMPLSKENLSLTWDIIGELASCDVTSEDFEQAVMEHFANLPDGNNGNILPFLKAAKRWFDVDVTDYFYVR